MDPHDNTNPREFEGMVYLTVICKFTKTEASSKSDLAEEIRSTVKHKLSDLQCDVEIEDTDIIEIGAKPSFWDEVDAAYQHKKENEWYT